MRSRLAAVSTKSCFGYHLQALSKVFTLLAVLFFSVDAGAQEFDKIETDIIGAKVDAIEKKAVDVVDQFQQQRSTFRDENLSVYLTIYTALISAVLSLAFAFISYRFSDKMSPYKRVRLNTSLLAAATGLGVGIFVAALEVPSNHLARLSLLLLLITTGAVVMGVVSWLAFVLLRAWTLREARMEGRAFSLRMRQG